MVNHMGYNKATFFMNEMRELHNERSLYMDIMSTDFMPAERLAEVRAAYGLPACADSLDTRRHIL